MAGKQSWCGRTSTAAVLLLLGFGLALGSCVRPPPPLQDSLRAGFSDLRETARSSIVDADRLARYLDLADEMEAELLAFERFAAAFLDDYRRNFVDHAADEPALRRLGADFRARQHAAQERFVGLHLAMAELVTDEEWSRLSEREVAIVRQLLLGATGTRG